MEIYGSQPFYSGVASITTTAATEDGVALVVVHVKPATAAVSTPPGFTPIMTIDGVNSKAVIFVGGISSGEAKTISAGTSVSGSAAGDGVIWYLLSEKSVGDINIGSTAVGGTNNFTSTHTAPAIACEVGDLIVNAVLWDQYPREGYTADSTERIDDYANYGPATAVGSLTASATTEGPFVWKSDDPNAPSADPANPESSGTERSTSFTVRLYTPSGTAGPPTLTGGGEIPIVEIGSGSWSGLDGAGIGDSTAATITVLDDEGNPFESLVLSVSVSGANTLSSQTITTDENGEATVTVTTPSAGNFTISAAHDGHPVSSASFGVSGEQTTLVVSANSVYEGQLITLSGETQNTDGTPIPNAALSFQIGGVTWEPVTVVPTTSTASGTYAFSIQITSSGSLIAQAVANGVASNSVTVTVFPAPSVDEEIVELRLRTQDYTRTNPVKR